MRESPQTTYQIANDPGGCRAALVIATSVYKDPTLSKLRAPGEDAKQLAAVLADEGIGQFDVETLLDAPLATITRRIAQFCQQRESHDTALVYLSCHGVLDDRGRLYYATTDTEREWLSVTALSNGWLIEHLEDCRCRQQILVLDCCHSGAFAKGTKGGIDLALRERVEGRGRVVLTASRATEHSFEGNRVIGESAPSVFTGALVEGLTSGDADSDNNGLITVTELYDYAYNAVKGTNALQNPGIWSYGAEGNLLIAHSPRGAVIEPAPLPQHLRATLESPLPTIRAAGVAVLGDFLDGPDVALALAARRHLEHVAATDNAFVAGAARVLVEAPPAGAQTTDASAIEPVAKTPTFGQASEVAHVIHVGTIWDVAFSPDGTRIVTAGDDNTARLWDTAGANELARFSTEFAVMSVAFSPDGYGDSHS